MKSGRMSARQPERQPPGGRGSARRTARTWPAVARGGRTAQRGRPWRMAERGFLPADCACGGLPNAADTRMACSDGPTRMELRADLISIRQAHIPPAWPMAKQRYCTERPGPIVAEFHLDFNSATGGGGLGRGGNGLPSRRGPRRRLPLPFSLKGWCFPGVFARCHALSLTGVGIIFGRPFVVFASAAVLSSGSRSVPASKRVLRVKGREKSRWGKETGAKGAERGAAGRSVAELSAQGREGHQKRDKPFCLLLA